MALEAEKMSQRIAMKTFNTYVYKDAFVRDMADLKKFIQRVQGADVGLGKGLRFWDMVFYERSSTTVCICMSQTALTAHYLTHVFPRP